MTDLNAKKLKRAQAMCKPRVSLEPEPPNPWGSALLIIFCTTFIVLYLLSGV
jgi:hypothetical protein